MLRSDLRRRSSIGRVAAVLWAAVAALSALPALALPTFAEVKAAHRPSDLVFTDRNGEPIQTLRVDKSVRRLGWVPLGEMSPALLEAIVLSEDRRFHEHAGVDWSAVAKSAWANAWNTKTRGASTLTMQLAGLIDDGLARPSAGRSVMQKIGQAIVATRLERGWSKAEILEAYLNSVPLRGEIVGIEAVAQTLFVKHASGLDLHEAALAAALVRAPNASADAVAERACRLLAARQLACTGIVGIAHQALARRAGMPLGEQLAPHFARQRLAALSGEAVGAVRTSLDARLQRMAIRTLRSQLGELSDRNVEDGALVVLDNASGEVLAWVGSSGDLSGAAAVDGVLARRQPGSTLKPFVYALAFEKRLVTPATLIDDSPAQLATPSGLYLPQNYDRDFKGWVSVRTALGSSLNVPAVRVGAMLGPDALVERLDAFGLALPESGGYYGNSIALGSADVTLLALTNAYRALANGGRHAPVGFAAQRPVADPAAVALVTDILADNNARARTFGLTSRLATRGFAAVKTGTSKDMRDNWAIGYTDRYTVGVWVGNASGAPMHAVSGTSGAAPIWKAIVEYLHVGRASLAPSLPGGVVRERIAFEDAREPARDELFIAGTQASAGTAPSGSPPGRAANLRASTGASSTRVGRRGSPLGPVPSFGIATPRDGSVFALDPDMPPSAQSIVFEGEPGTWVLDGKRLGAAPRWRWAPWPGRHELTLLGADGAPLQSVRFEVRGAVVARPAARSR